MLRRLDLGRGAHTLAAAAAGPVSVSGLYRGAGRAAACRLNVVAAHLAGAHYAVPSRAGWPDGLRLLSTSSSSAAPPPCDSGGGRLLAGKTALVTGSTQGIGLGIARELCRNGASLVINGFGDPKEIEKTRASLQAINNQPVHYINADLCKPQEIEHLIAQSIQKLGKLDIVVNNAGIQYLSPIEDFPVEKWQMIIDLNLSSVFHTMRLTLPHMRQRSYGRIINISSVHGIVASKHKAAYVAAKHAVVGLTKVAALEYAGSGVTCNCINPGWVLTDLVQKQIEAKASDLKVSVEEAKNILLSEKQPSLSFATPEQLGQLAVFLCSEAADQITGINIPVDGGWTAQ